MDFTRSFVEYDVEVTKKGSEKGLKNKRKVKKKSKGTEEFYI